MAPQETTTDRLVSIIQLIQLGKQTGVLRVRRGEGNVLEEGMIAFANGQVVQAQNGRYRGSEAINRLSGWGTCRFIFAPSDTSNKDTSLSPHFFERVGNVIRRNHSALDDQPVTGDLSNSRYLSSQSVRPSTGSVMPLPIGNPKDTPSPGLPVPYRKLEINTALNLLEHKRLSRAHRRVLLLIDGQRSIQEVVRLVGRSGKEVQSLLSDLEQASIISFYLA